jgi:hypothetical protein
MKVCIDFGYCNRTRFQTRGHKVQTWVFLLFAHGEFIYFLILKGFTVMNSLGQSVSDK